MKPQVKARDYLSIAEFNAAVEAFSKADWIRLEKFSNYICWGLNIEGMDLLQKVFEKVLEDKRHCPREVPVKVFICGAMQSWVDNYLKKSKRDVLHQSVELPTDTEQEDSLSILDTPEQLLIAKQKLAQIENAFEDDETVRMIFMAQQDNYSPQEIQQIVGLTPVEYDSALKAIRRKFDKLTKES